MMFQFACGCSHSPAQNIISNITATPTEHSHSAMLIDRFNTLRELNNLGKIEHDTILDNISKILMANQFLKNAEGVYNEDSVRLLLYKNGVIDYHYTIQETLDIDTVIVYSKFLLADKSDNIRVGSFRNGVNNILFKTTSFLKFIYGTMSVHSDKMDWLHNQTSAKVYTDSIIHYFKILIPDEYYYQFYDHIPSNIDKMQNIKMEQGYFENLSINENFDLIIKSRGLETEMFLIISGKNNGRVIVTK